MKGGFLLDTNVLSELMRAHPVAAEQMFEQDFAARALGFDAAAAKNYAVIVANRSRLGQPISTEDAQIAAIALAGGLTLVTRKLKDFENIEHLKRLNPWQPMASH